MIYVKDMKICPKCGGVMYVGRIYPGEFKTPVKFADAPSKKWGFSFAPRKKKEVIAYACQECGYVECYIDV
jgi:predicted nucleic-acid-binding Zn-ribbon protein